MERPSWNTDMLPSTGISLLLMQRGRSTGGGRRGEFQWDEGKNSRAVTRIGIVDTLKVQGSAL